MSKRQELLAQLEAATKAIDLVRGKDQNQYWDAMVDWAEVACAIDDLDKEESTTN